MMANQSQSANHEALDYPGTGAKFLRPNYKRLWLLGVVITCGIAISIAAYWILIMQDAQMAEVQFQLEAKSKVETIQQAIEDQLSVMSLIRAFFAGSEEVNRSEFKIFTDSIIKEHPYTAILAWMPRVRPEEKSSFEEAAEKMGFAQYRITERRDGQYLPAAQREQHFPILYIQPAEKYRAVLGFDIASIPRCLAAMDWSDSNLGPAISYDGIPGIDDDSGPTYFLFESTRTETPASALDIYSTRSADGFILCGFRVCDVIEKSLELLQPAGMDIYIFDMPAAGKPKLILSYPSKICKTPFPSLTAPPGDSSADIAYSERISVADKTWLVHCRPADTYFYGHSRWGPSAVMPAGLLITGLVAGYIFLLSGRTARIEKLVDQRSGELQVSEQRFRLLLENAADGVFIYDDKQNILDVNQQACEQLGYTRDELLKMHTADFEIGLPPQVLGHLGCDLPDKDFPVTIHGVHRRKDGSTHPVEVRSSSMQIAGKRFVMAIVRDVTERKQAEEALRKEQRFLRHLIDLQERERKLVAYEIHDGLAQQLTGALFKLQSVDHAQEIKDYPTARKILDESLLLIRESVNETRRLISGLRPPILDESGIVAAIEYLCGDRRQKNEPDIEFEHHVQFRRLSQPLEVALFRIAQECLTNARRYSQSPRISVELIQLENRARLTVQDWGVGFDLQAIKGEHYGLRGMRERVRLLGGTVEINSSPKKGAIIIVELPLAEGDIDEDDNGG
jgi:PAS domain S-box-containing protein